MQQQQQQPLPNELRIRTLRGLRIKGEEVPVGTVMMLRRIDAISIVASNKAEFVGDDVPLGAPEPVAAGAKGDDTGPADPNAANTDNPDPAKPAQRGRSAAK